MRNEIRLPTDVFFAPIFCQRSGGPDKICWACFFGLLRLWVSCAGSIPAR